MENKETGEQVEDNDFERLKKRGYYHEQVCEHCYCKREMTSSGEHSICCMCGHRHLTNPITF